MHARHEDFLLLAWNSEQFAAIHPIYPDISIRVSFMSSFGPQLTMILFRTHQNQAAPGLAQLILAVGDGRCDPGA